MRFPRDAASWAAGLITMSWAFVAWLTVSPNQDLLADGVQVQRILQSPYWVLTFPGQKHGGILEYPYSLLAEWAAPGDYLLHSVIRVAFAFLTGFTVAKLFRTLFPGLPRTWLLIAMAVGPTILQGLVGPASNAFGVYWLNANYDLSYLFATLSCFVLASSRGLKRSAFAGGLAGLGLYQQPTIIIALLPLLALVIILRRWPLSTRDVAFWLAGCALSLVPAVISFIWSPVVTWDPSRFPRFWPMDWISAWGLDGMPAYQGAVLPYALGLATSESATIRLTQSLLMWVVVVVVIVCCTLAVRTRVVSGAWTTSGALAISWGVALSAIAAFSAFINVVWFYGAGLALLTWISIGVLPSIINRPLGVIASVSWIALMATSSFAQNAWWYRDFPTRVSQKQEYLASLRVAGEQLSRLGVRYIFGSYYDAIPIAYGSGGRLHPITTTYNRFPAKTGDSTPVLIAYRTNSKDSWGLDAVQEARLACSPPSTFLDFGPLGMYEIAMCPSSLVQEPPSPTSTTR